MYHVLHTSLEAILIILYNINRNDHEECCASHRDRILRRPDTYHISVTAVKQKAKRILLYRLLISLNLLREEKTMVDVSRAYLSYTESLSIKSYFLTSYPSW